VGSHQQGAREHVMPLPSPAFPSSPFVSLCGCVCVGVGLEQCRCRSSSSKLVGRSGGGLRDSQGF